MDLRSGLKLTHFYEMDPNFMNIRLVQQLCPNIQYISLSLPITINANGHVNADVTPCSSILTAMAESSLELKVVELHHFPFCDAFRKLLRTKGAKLQELLLRASSPIYTHHVALIGKHCPRLTKLHLKELGPDPAAPVLEEDEDDEVPLPRPDSLFCQLLQLHLSGMQWNPNAVLPMVLGSAKQVQRISLMNTNYNQPMDRAMKAVLERNQLDWVTAITFYNGCFLSMSLIRRLALHCPHLTNFSFCQADSFDLIDVERLKMEVAVRNLDIKLLCMGVFLI